MSNINIYKTKDGKIELNVNLSDETVWLSLNQITELFERDKSVISRHLSNIFENNELEKDSVVANFATAFTLCTFLNKFFTNSGNRFSWVQAFRTNINTVHNATTAENFISIV